MNDIIRINDENQVFCSLIPTTTEEKKVLYNALNNTSGKISDYINQELLIQNVYMEQVELNDSATGEPYKAVRSIIITPDGQGIACTSNGIAKSLYGIFQIFGTPDQWDGEIIAVIVRQIETPKGRTFKFEIK